MEQIEIGLSEFTLRSRSVAVSHNASGLERGLEPGEPIVVSDPGTGHFFAAAVVDVDFEIEDTVYRVEIGSRIAPEEAADWIADVPDSSTGQVTTREILDLLNELQRSRRFLQAMADDVAR